MEKKNIVGLTLVMGVIGVLGITEYPSWKDSERIEINNQEEVRSAGLTKEDISLCYWDAANMKLHRVVMKMENPTAEKMLRLLTQEISETGFKKRLPKELIIEKVEIDPTEKIARLYVTLDEQIRGNYSSSAWAETCTNTIVHTLIENESLGIEKVILGKTLTDTFGYSDNIYFELEDGEVVADSCFLLSR